MKQMKKQLRTVTTKRTVGFADAVKDLGTHTVCGNQVPYTTVQVRKVLKGEHKSLRLMHLIAERRPDLFGLWFVAPEVATFGKTLKAGRAK